MTLLLALSGQQSTGQLPALLVTLLAVLAAVLHGLCRLCAVLLSTLLISDSSILSNVSCDVLVRDNKPAPSLPYPSVTHCWLWPVLVSAVLHRQWEGAPWDLPWAEAKTERKLNPCSERLRKRRLRHPKSLRAAAKIS